MFECYKSMVIAHQGSLVLLYSHLVRGLKVVIINSQTVSQLGGIHLLIRELNGKVEFGDIVYISKKNEIMLNLEKCILEHLENRSTP